jgi:Na+-transporting NADH:ubiquinone oxidoreductase subunit A
MKIPGGYRMRITGHPSAVVGEAPLAPRLILDLTRNGLRYAPVRQPGDTVKQGEQLAECRIGESTLCLPSPVSGYIDVGGDDATLCLRVTEHGREGMGAVRLNPDRVPAGAVRQALVRNGLWPLLWSSARRGMPDPDRDEAPAAIVVNTLFGEPFRTQGSVVLRRSWGRVVQGLQFLQHLTRAYGMIHFVLPEQDDPMEHLMREDLAGHAWIHFHRAPLKYPVENRRILDAAIRNVQPQLDRDCVLWIVDVQGLEAIGACLGEGSTPTRRVVCVAGPAMPAPRHLSVEIGTPVADLIPQRCLSDDILVLRGGLFNGTPIDPRVTGVQYDDDAFFLMPRTRRREWLTFLHAGSSRRSALPCFFSNLVGVPDKQVSSLLRGERRPCIACGLCETVCPARIMPQLLHRHLYAGKLDRAEQDGLDGCVDCGLCTYVCPSKIDLHHEFRTAREEIRCDHEATGT